MSEIDSGRSPKKRRDYDLTTEAKEQRLVASQHAADIRRVRTNENISDSLEKLTKSINKYSEEELDKISLKEKVVAAGILYDKLYRNEKEHRQIQAIQINIKAPEGATETLDLSIKPESGE